MLTMTMRRLNGQVNIHKNLMSSQKVQIYLYDLSHGMAKSLSQAFLGVDLEGIWHTGVVVFGTEYFFGGGIQRALPGQTVAGRQVKVIDMGTTSKTRSEFETFLALIAHKYTAETYSLLRHNCNNFSDEVCKYLTSEPLPEYITGLPERALSSPMGKMLRDLIENFESNMKGTATPFVPWAETESNGRDSHLAGLKIVSLNPKPLISMEKGGKSDLDLVALMERKNSISGDERKALEQFLSTAVMNSNVENILSNAFSHWDKTKLFPLTALLRSLCTQKRFAVVLCEKLLLLQSLIENMFDSPAKLSTEIMTLCFLSNLLAFKTVPAVQLASSDAMVECTRLALEHPNDTVKMMGATVCFNCAVLLLGEENEARIGMVSALAFALGEHTQETKYRMLLALSHLILGSEEASNLLHALEPQLPSASSDKVRDLLDDLKWIMSSVEHHH